MMITTLRSFWQNLVRPADREETVLAPSAPAPAPDVIDLDLAPHDPLLAYFQQAPQAVDVHSLTLDSPALDRLRAAGIQLVVPLVSQGELIGLINLGPRRSEQEYSSEDRKLLDDLAAQAAPAVRVAQLVRQQQRQAAERERMEHEMRVARLIQQTLLPQAVPQLDGWAVAAYYQPARAVGGDFYDFLYFPDGRVGFVIGDVTDKGVPAALVMATTRTLLRASAERLVDPGAVLKRVNDVLCDEIPPKMFVTCLYALLDPGTGQLRYANAGHDLPYCRRGAAVLELRATGMPLGLMPGMEYEEKETTLQPGDTVLLYSDGLVEAHSPTRAMFGFPRLQALIAEHAADEGLTGFLLDRLAAFTGAGWEQEDDVTLVTLQCATLENGPTPVDGATPADSATPLLAAAEERLLGDFSLPSEPGNERQALARVAELTADLPLDPARRERLKTAVAEATMNAMEHGNQYRADAPVHIAVAATPAALIVRITDQGGGALPAATAAPDLDAKLAGEQSPRGWGLFLIRNMVDEARDHDDGQTHTLELVLRLDRESSAA